MSLSDFWDLRKKEGSFNSNTDNTKTLQYNTGACSAPLPSCLVTFFSFFVFSGTGSGVSVRGGGFLLGTEMGGSRISRGLGLRPWRSVLGGSMSSGTHFCFEPTIKMISCYFDIWDR